MTTDKSELRTILHHYVRQNGRVLGIMFFKAHLKEQGIGLGEEYDIEQELDLDPCFSPADAPIKDLNLDNIEDVLAAQLADLKEMDRLIDKEHPARSLFEKWYQRIQRLVE
jgi:hypothetical protein